MMLKLGRKPRRRDPRVPHLSALLAGVTLPPPPPAVDYTANMPTSLGMLKNDELGDCTCAAALHAQQVWTFNANPPMETVTDEEALALYEGACGYDPSQTQPDGSNPTDQGGDEQTVLTYWMNSGVAGNKLAAFVEVDPRNTDDVKRAIADCALVYIGFNVPNFLMVGNNPPPVWDVDPAGDNGIAGGHAVILPGYDANGLKVVSWGQLYTMTWAFFAAFVDEVYALADAEWITLGGMSVAGLTLAQLEAQMSALKEQGT